MILPPRLSEREVVYTNPYYRVFKVAADFGTHAKTYYVADCGHKAGVVVDRSGSILVVQQYRFVPNRLSWEIPAGRVESGESADQAAARECYEESGVKCGRLTPLLRFHAGTDTLLSPTSLFHTRDFSEEGLAPALQTHEVVRYAWMPIAQCMQMIYSQEIVDSCTIIALLAYQGSVCQK